MKKLLAIVASALTLGAFANSAADPVFTADTSAVPSGTTCSVMAGDEEAFSFATTGGEVTLELDEAYVGRRVCLAVGGEEITDSTIAQMGAANPKLGAIKTIGTGDAITVDSGTLDDPTVLTVADVDAASEVVIKSGCAAKVAPGGNKTWKITGEGSDSYIILDGTANYGFDEGSKFTNVTIVIDAPGRNVWLEDRATDVYGESVNLIIKQGTVTFGAGKQANPIVSFGTITKEGGTLASNGGTKVVAKTLALGQTATPEYMFEGLLWNNDNDGHWYADTTSASGTTITAEDKVVFNGCDKVLYNHCTTASKIVVSAGTLKIGHNDQGGNNLAAGSVVTIASGATAELRCWDSNPCNTYTVRFPGVTFNGPGSVVVNDYVKHISVGSLAGNAPLNIKSADIVLANGGSIAYTGAISGSGTIPYFTGLTVASGWTGTVMLPEMDAIGGNVIDLNQIGNANSKVSIARVSSGWLKVTPTTINVNPTLVLNGEFVLNDYSDRYYVFTGIEGSGNFSVVKKAGANTPKSVTINTIDSAKYTGAIKSAVNATLTIVSLKTTLDELPSEKTKVLSIAEDSTDTVAVTAATFADGTAIDAENVFVESDGIYVGPKASSVPGIDLIPEGEKTEYEVWAATNGVAADPEMSEEQAAAYASNCAIAFHLGASVSEGVTIEDAAQAKVEELVAKIDCSKLAGEDGLNAALETLNGELAEKGLVASLKPVELEGASESTKLYQLVITLKTEN